MTAVCVFVGGMFSLLERLGTLPDGQFIWLQLDNFRIDFLDEFFFFFLLIQIE